MTKRPPLTSREVERGLKSAGFVEQPGTGTSHVKWILKTPTTKLVVTVDAHHSPFSKTLIASMASQAGMSVNQFYELCSKDGQKQAKRGTLGWLTRLFE